MKQTLFPTLIAFIAFQSCDGPYANCDEYSFSDELKSYVSFPAQSSWVYHDSQSSKSDSVVLLGSSTEQIDYCDYKTSHEEILTQTFTIDGYRTTAVSHASLTYNQHGDAESIGQLDLERAERMDTMTVNGTLYENVVKYQNGGNTFYWAKNIGPIRKEFSDNGTVYTMDLMSYKIP